MIENKERKVGTDIFILSQLSLQTDSITYAIEHEMDVMCHIFDHDLHIFSDIVHNIHEPYELNIDSSVILIDREIHRFRNITKSITEDRHFGRAKIALFNVNGKTTVDKSIMSKQIRGIFFKDDHLETLIKGIKAIIGDQIWISRETLLQYLFEDKTVKKRDFAQSKNLTKREVEILTLVSMGATNDEIADKIFISTNTVKTHLYNIFKKIDVQNRIQAALWAAKKL